MYNDAIKVDTLKLPAYLRWKMPLTHEQLAAWQNTGLTVVGKADLPECKGSIITYWGDQRSRAIAKVRRYQNKHRLLGLCLDCPEPIGPTSTLRCEPHHQSRLANQRRYRECTLGYIPRI